MLEDLAEKGMTPKALETRPSLPSHLVCAWDCFSTLNRERPQAMSGVCALPMSTFLLHANLHQFTRADTQDIWNLVRVLDREFVDFHQKRQSAQVAADKRKAKKP